MLQCWKRKITQVSTVIAGIPPSDLSSRLSFKQSSFKSHGAAFTRDAGPQCNPAAHT